MQTDEIDAPTALQDLRHRFRNSLQVVNSLVGLHARGIADPTARSAFSDLRSRLTILSTIFTDLDEEGQAVELEEFLPRIARKAANLQPAESACPLALAVVPARISASRAAVLAQILSEMLMDAFRRGESDRTRPIDVRLSATGKNRLALTVGVPLGASSDAAAEKLSQTIIKSMASTLQGSFSPPSSGGGEARVEFDRDPP